MPVGRSTKKVSLHRQTGIIYGPPKVGKTTIASGIPKALFLATERGLDHVDVERWQNDQGNYVITSWEELLLATKEAIESKYEAIVIDTIGNACALCDAYICALNGEGFKNDGKLGFNKGTTLILNEIKRYLTKLQAQDIGVWLVAHSASKTETKRTGNIEKTVPFLPGDNKASELYNAIIGAVDHIWYAEVQPDGVNALLHTKPGGVFDAGDRSAILPDKVPVNAGTFAVMAEAYAKGKVTPAPSTPTTSAKGK